MTRIIMHGCNGKMGQVVSGLAAADENVQIVAGIDVSDSKANPYPVFHSLAECSVEADVVIDFSYAGAVDGLVDACVEKHLPVIVCTTGLSDSQMAHLHDASQSIPVLKSANMSVGINLLMKILQPVAQTLAEAGFDIEIVEKHHNQKLDAPSGTALALADVMNGALDDAYTYKYDRSQVREKRSPKEIGISAVRGGTIVGEHEIIFAGTDEVITFKHTAYSKAIFAKGAIEAAKYLKGRPAGFYDMSDVIGS
jgi:4-hydroxy-tetrahydrodipicolinate reductase